MLADLHVLAADDHEITVWEAMNDEARVAAVEGEAESLRVVTGVRDTIGEVVNVLRRACSPKEKPAQTADAAPAASTSPGPLG